MGGLEQNPKLVGKRQIRRADSEGRVTRDPILTTARPRLPAVARRRRVLEFPSSFNAERWKLDGHPGAFGVDLYSGTPYTSCLWKVTHGFSLLGGYYPIARKLFLLIKLLAGASWHEAGTCHRGRASDAVDAQGAADQVSAVDHAAPRGTHARER